MRDLHPNHLRAGTPQVARGHACRKMMGRGLCRLEMGVRRDLKPAEAEATDIARLRIR